ncbi:MAG: hypothetical protein JXA09_17335 [Anaerolineae bacterium]|nr:hypothetical protein [Anaerolineae bacterium]
MRPQMWTAQRLLSSALLAYNGAEDAEEMREALLALHAAVAEALSAYLSSQRNAPRNIGALRFAALVDAARTHTDLFRGDERAARVLLALDETRTRVQNPGQDPPPQEIARHATQAAQVTRRMWPRLFDEPCPIALDPAKATPLPERVRQEAPSSAGVGYGTPAPTGRLAYGASTAGWAGQAAASPRAQTPPVARRDARPGPEAPAPSTGARVGRVLKALWADPSGLPLRGRVLFGRLLALVGLLYAAQGCRRAALSTARWPSPIRYASLVLVFLAACLLVWALIVAWRALWQLKLSRLAVIVGVAYLLVVLVSLLTSGRSMSVGSAWWLVTRQSASYVGRQVGGFVRTVVDTPAALRFAYTESRRPQRLEGLDVGDLAVLTPVPANIPYRALTPTVTPTPVLPEPASQLSPTPVALLFPTSAPPAALRPPICPDP